MKWDWENRTSPFGFYLNDFISFVVEIFGKLGGDFLLEFCVKECSHFMAMFL
jgi:hypothetical protein